MGVAWQEPAALSIVALTALALLGAALRRRRRTPVRPARCGCGAGQPPAPVASILLRGRKGQTPQLIVRLR